MSTSAIVNGVCTYTFLHCFDSDRALYLLMADNETQVQIVPAGFRTLKMDKTIEAYSKYKRRGTI